MLPKNSLEAQPSNTVRYHDSVTTVRRGSPSLLSNMEIERSRAEQDLKANLARRETDQKQLAQLDEQIKSLDKRESDLAKLDLQQKLVEETYRSTMKLLDQQKLEETLVEKTAANIRVIEPAEAPLNPANSRLLILVSGALLSLFVGVLVAWLSALFRRSFLASAEIEKKLGIPVLLTVPLAPISRGSAGAEFDRFGADASPRT